MYRQELSGASGVSDRRITLDKWGLLWYSKYTMKNTSLAVKQAQSRAEKGCSIPFSRREFAIIAVMAHSALSDADLSDAVIAAIPEQNSFQTDEPELEGLRDKLEKFLDTEN